MKFSTFNRDKGVGMKPISQVCIGFIVVMAPTSAILSLHQLPLQS